MAIAADITLLCSQVERAGIKQIYIKESCSVTAATADASNHAFTAMTVASDTFKFELEPDTNGVEIVQSDNGKGYTCTFTGRIENPTKAQKKVLNDAAVSRYVVCWLETNMSSGTNNHAYVLGYDAERGDCRAEFKVDLMNEASAIEGSVYATVTVTANQLEMPREMVGTIPYNVTTVAFGS